MSEIQKSVEIVNNAETMNSVGNMDSIGIINNVGKLDYDKLMNIVWIVDKQLLYCLTKLYAYCLSDALLQVKARKQRASGLSVAEVCRVHTV